MVLSIASTVCMSCGAIVSHDKSFTFHECGSSGRGVLVEDNERLFVSDSINQTFQLKSVPFKPQTISMSPEQVRVAGVADLLREAAKFKINVDQYLLLRPDKIPEKQVLLIKKLIEKRKARTTNDG